MAALPTGAFRQKSPCWCFGIYANLKFLLRAAYIGGYIEAFFKLFDFDIPCHTMATAYMPS